MFRMEKQLLEKTASSGFVRAWKEYRGGLLPLNIVKKILEILVTPYHPLFLSLTYSTTLHSCLLWPHIYVALLMFLSWNCIPYSSTWLPLKETPRFASLMTPWKGNFSDLAFRFISFLCLHTDDELQIKFWQLPTDRGRSYFYLNSTFE